jgi:predicted acetyltransferase
MCVDASTALMIREGYDMGFLFGIRDFYDKFGYITCMAEHTLTMDTRDAERAKSSLRCRSATRTDSPVLARIYNRDTASLTGSCKRIPSRWSGFTMGSFFARKVAARIVTDSRGLAAGYVAYDDETDKVCASEIVGTGSETYGAILHFLAGRAVKLRREEISFKLPADHPFARWARQFGLVDKTSYPRNSNAMARITNLRSCLEKVSGELCNRISGRFKPTSFRLSTDVGTSHLSWTGKRLIVGEGGRGSVVRVRQDHLVQLLMGYRSPADLIAADELKAARHLHPILEALFPLHSAQMWWSDRF